MNILIIGIGGAVGAIMRVGLTYLLPPTVLNIPFKILIVNVLGCFLAGICVVFLSVKLHNERLNDFLISGFLGSFTTFSAFAIDIGRLYDKDLLLALGCYIVTSLAFSLFAFFMGIKLMRYCLS
ncbi:MAG: CrcB family protein [Alphaproteobacteria bacterium]|nr:CrcB family protein [Alphaproteobacteria bacterium]